jgi:hypothetical protein
MHSSTAIKILMNRDWHIHLALNPNTPPETLARLADHHTVSSIRYYVLKNPNTPKYIKEYLNAIEFYEAVL